ncbi:uncharacterized protein LOC122262354 [Penaeus japonicus]|uniref:uncharacterized protein LOC122262354 n=1 Tax=Penaeus japonicus TaxID=27405 RepID=UPI001C7125E6|nr:uncharacterized protein LOC122262354 [Penaeus japonicus]
MKPREPNHFRIYFHLEFAERTVKHFQDFVAADHWSEVKLYQNKERDIVFRVSFCRDKVIPSNPGQKLLRYYAESSEALIWTDLCPQDQPWDRRSFSCPDLGLDQTTGV